MNWMYFMLLSAFFLALYDLAKKASVSGNAVLPTLLCSAAFGSASFISACCFSGVLSESNLFDTRIFLFSATKALIVSTSWILTFCGLKTLPISIATPIRSGAPAIVFVVALVLYNEVPTVANGIGMLLVFLGYFIFSWAGRHEGIDMLRNKAVWCAFGGMFLSAVSSLWDKYVFQIAHADVTIVQFWFQIFLFLVYVLLYVLQKCTGAPCDRFQWRWTIPFVGIFLVCADWLYFTGLSEPGVPISVGSLLRRASVVITFVLGAKFFHETNLRRKAIALAVILFGIFLLSI